MVLAQELTPPVDTREQVLPFDCLAWENFERLCLKLALERGKVDHAVDHAAGDRETGRMSAREARAQGGLYGTRGQKQQGIDLYVRLPPAGDAPPGSGASPRYLSLQSRRVAKLTAAGLKKAVGDFLGGSWASASDVFVYATSLPAVQTEQADEIARQTQRLAAKGIEFEVWDAEALSTQLKSASRHVLVDDFFGRVWVRRFCGSEAADALGERLDAAQVGAFREKLGRFYRAFFGVIDPGTAALGRSDAPRLELRDRFVLPDLLAPASAEALSFDGARPQPPSGASAQESGPTGEVYELLPEVGGTRIGGASYRALRRQSASWPPGLGPGVGSTSLLAAGAALRMNADGWFASGDRLVLVGGPGSGKSTFLRFAVLDLFSDEPSMPVWTERFGGLLPVWLPFHFLTRRRQQHDDAAASIEATLQAWLGQHNAGHLWPLVEQALTDERLLLIVDGLDEWVDESAGNSAAMALEIYLAARNTPAIVSTRPYGLARLSLSARWSRADLAPLSEAQQRRLAELWFRAYSEDGEAGAADPKGGESAAVDGFIEEVRGLPELRSLAQVPLFLLLLIGLRLAGVQLPTRRFDVYGRVVDRLLKDHPARRATAASAAAPYTSMPQDDVRQVLAHVAYEHQSRGDFGPVSEAAVRRDVVAALRDPDHLAMQEESAAANVRPFVEVAEGRLGVLVRQGPRELSFLHRVLLEQLAAEHAADHLSEQELGELFAGKAADPRWKEVLLGVLWRSGRPKEVAQLTAILAEQAEGQTPAALGVSELLAEIAFGSYRLPAADAARHAQTSLNAIETHPYLPHRARLLSAAVPGIEHPTAGLLLRERLPRWTLARQPLPPAALYYMVRLPKDGRTDAVVLPVLLASLADEDPRTAKAGAVAIATRYSDGERSDEVRTALVNVVRRPGTAQHAAMALASLFLGWPEDEQVQRLLAAARQQPTGPTRLIGLAARLGILLALLREQDPPPEPRDAWRAATDDDRAWLAHQLDAEHLGREHWVPYISASLVAATAGLPDEGAQLRDRCLRIVEKDTREFGDRAIAWAVLMRGHARDTAVVAFVRRTLATDLRRLYFLGLGRLATAYSGDPDIAQAVEDGLRGEPTIMDTELHTLAGVDHGPVLRDLLLRSFAERGFPHWAAGALATHWADDPTVHQALREALSGAPERASTVANVAVRVLGARAARERLLELISHIPAPGKRIRRDIVTYALLEACQELGETTGPDAENVAQACLTALDPDDLWDRDAEAAVLTVLPETHAARTRAEQMLALPQPPVTALLAGYGQDRTILAKTLRIIANVAPPLPAALRLHLSGLLENATPANAFVRAMTRDWPLEPDELVRSAASAAYHTHLLDAHRRAADDAGEWDAALKVLRREALAAGWANGGRRRSAWLGILLLDELGILSELRERDQSQQAACVGLGDLIGELDTRLLGEIAARWPQLRAHFGGELLRRISGGLSQDTDEAWQYLALVADRHPALQRELSDAVAADETLLRHDGVLAWYARTHRGETGLPATLVAHLHDHDSNLRALASLLLGRPEMLGLTPDIVANALHTPVEGELRFSPPYHSAALEALADAAPDDARVRACWAATLAQREQDGHLEMHPRTYYPLAYAAEPADGFIARLCRDIDHLISIAGGDYSEPQLAAAAARRLGRDPEARRLLDEHIRAADTTDQRAAQLAHLAAGAHPLDPETVRDLSARLERQFDAEAPDMVHDCGSGDDVPVYLLLLGVLSGYPADTSQSAG